MAEHPKSKSTGGFYQADGSSCINGSALIVELLMYLGAWTYLPLLLKRDTDLHGNLRRERTTVACRIRCETPQVFGRCHCCAVLLVGLWVRHCVLEVSLNFSDETAHKLYFEVGLKS